MMHRTLLSALLLASAAHAQSPPPDLAITIYNNDLALVQDKRSLDLPAGSSRQEFRDVSARIRPETVTLAINGASIVEQNFDFDLLTPTKMMDKAVGQVVTIVRTNPATGVETREQARVLAANEGVVLQIGNRIEVLRDDGLPVRVVFDHLPDNLRARPTLSITLDAAKAGPRPARLSYLTTGLGWKADYVALFDEAAGKLDMQGWVTLTNEAGTSFPNADVVLVAGQPATSSGNDDDSDYRPRPRHSMASAGTEGNDRGQLGDFYLYPLAARTTIADAQTKQVSFLDVKGVAAAKAYEFRVPWSATFDEPQSAATVLRFANSTKGGLGDQLPAGIIRFYARDAKGQPQFIGESPIAHTPMGSELGLKTGEAFDVKVKVVQQAREKMSDKRWRTTMVYTVSNARAQPVTVNLFQGGLWGDNRVVNETLASKRKDADTLQWAVPVPANGSTTVTVSYDTRF
jgi:hypothetical protein